MHHSRRLLALLVLLAASAGVAAAGPAVVEFRIRREPGVYRRGTVLEHDDRGFLFDRFGVAEKRFYLWDDLQEEDLAPLRRTLGLDPQVPGLEGKVAGEVIHFKGGLSIEGRLERVDREGVHWVRYRGVLLPYPADCIESIETARLDETAVFDRTDLIERRLRHGEPRTGEEHRDLADWLFSVGSFEEARDHYGAAIAARPELRYRLLPRLREIEDSLKSEIIASDLRKARALSALRGEHEQARGIVEALMAAEPLARRPGLMLLKEIEARAEEDLEARFRQVKHEELRDLMRHYLTTKDPTLEQAMAWATDGMPDELRARIGERLGLEPRQVDALAARQGKGAPHWASYWSGTFVIVKRLHPQANSQRSRIRANPEGWWHTYSDAEPRMNFLLAYAAERVPELFEVVQVRHEECERCSGHGTLEHVSLNRPIAGVGHEWREVCPRCFGAGYDRIVAYR